jgi:hypothetical protein
MSMRVWRMASQQTIPFVSAENTLQTGSGGETVPANDFCPKM